jgi:hypothetical protein
MIEEKRKSKIDFKRIRRAIKLGNLNEVINEYVPIIVYEGGIIRHNKMIPAPKRKPFKRCKYDIDDGNHRAISLALEGKKDIFALVGKRVHKSDLLYF